ncbi:MAG TPA: hypothetical protein VMF59_00120 [Bacteroidota bacterium]|nr:hypothetical protein [Bacteroidota bacterium]
MSLKRLLLPLLLGLALVLGAFPSAEAMRPCAEALSRCSAGCSSQFGNTWLIGSVLVEGCVGGCNIGYFYCATSN